MYDILIYRDTNGNYPFIEWLETCSHKTQDRIQQRILRIQAGNLGDYKSLGQGVYELRMFFDGGIRVYFGKEGNRIVVLLCGGDKGTQKRDIDKAKTYWKDYRDDQ